MFIVTNRIKVKKGFAEKMAPMFTRPGALLNYEDFIKTEVAVASNFEEYDEMSVNMYWNTLEGFEKWRASDDFKAAHGHGPKGGASEGDAPKESPLLGSQIVIAEVTASIVK